MNLDELRKIIGEPHYPYTPQESQRINDLLRAAGYEPGEHYQHLEMTNRFVNTHRDISNSNTAIHLHSHNFYELMCCRNTCGAEYLIGTQRYKLQKGDILLVAPGVSHRPILPENLTEPYERDILWLSQEFTQLIRDNTPGIDDWQMPDTNLIRTAGTRWEILTDMFHAGVKEAEEKNFGWEMIVLGNTISLVASLWRALRFQTANQLRAEAPDLLDQIMAYIEIHLSEKITLSDTAKHFYVSESTISHLFRQRLGVSFYRCVTQRRLISAKEMIWKGYPMDAVAEKVGFSDYSSFFRAFKREYGVPPKQYKKMTASSNEPK